MTGLSSSSSTNSTSTLPTLPAAPADNRFRLLVIENDATTSSQILALLGKMGFDCYQALDSEAGMASFTQNNPHLLLLNFASAETGGDAFCRWVRQQSTIPLIALGPNEENLEVAAFKIGADDYLSAPLRPAVLLARVVAQLRRAYRYNVPPAAENPFGLSVEESSNSKGGLPSGWAECDLCGYQGPHKKFEKEDYLGNRKQACPNCDSTEHIIISLN